MLTKRQNFSRRVAFTLVEMLVVIAIIGLLVGVLLPVFSTVRTKARYAQAGAQFSAIESGLNMFRGEGALGGVLPPSTGDNSDPQLRDYIANPQKTSDSPTERVAGAHLLVHALIGADGLGTPGFRDFDRDGEGTWSDDTHAGTADPTDGPHGAYYIFDQGANAGQEAHARYSGYVDEKMSERAKSLQGLEDQGVLLNLGSTRVATSERVFVDPWDTPILYYKANPAAFRVTDGETPGIFRQADNAVITGSDGTEPALDGLDFGAGKIDGRYHDLYLSICPPAVIDPENPIWEDPEYVGSFARFVVDRKIQGRYTPARKDSYLLISAGPDARYGTEDDVTNWPREVQ